MIWPKPWAGMRSIWTANLSSMHVFLMYLHSESQPMHMRKILKGWNSIIADLDVRVQYYVLNWLLAYRKQERMLEDFDDMVVEQNERLPQGDNSTPNAQRAVTQLTRVSPSFMISKTE
jgi:hypothetical protein